MNRLSKLTAALIVYAPALGISGGASAGDLGGGGNENGGPPVKEGDWSVTGVRVGGILNVKPKYEGSSEYEVGGLPFIFPVISGGSGSSGFFSRVESRGLDDVRFALLRRDGFIAGPVVGYSLGRDEDDGDLLEGLGDIDGGAVAGGFVGYRWGTFQIDAAYRQFFDDSEGYLIDFNAKVVRPINERLSFTGSIGATYADENYMDTYFGAGAFVADAGFKDVHVEIGLKAELSERWAAQAGVRYSRLLGDAADSPIVEDENQWEGTVGLSYKFDFGR
jgi:outer membrane protein